MSNFSFIPAATTVRSAAIAPTDNPSYLQFVGNAVKNNDVIILNRDTSMKGKGFVQLFETLAKPLSENRKKVVVPQAVLAELRHTADSPDTQESRKAKEAMEDIIELYRAGYIKFAGDPNVRETGSAWILKYVSREIWSQRILVLTQDAALAEDLMVFSRLRSTRPDNQVTVKRVSNDFGQLNNFHFDEDGRTSFAGRQDARLAPQSGTAPRNNAASVVSQRFRT